MGYMLLAFQNVSKRKWLKDTNVTLFIHISVPFGPVFNPFAMPDLFTY